MFALFIDDTKSLHADTDIYLYKYFEWEVEDDVLREYKIAFRYLKLRQKVEGSMIIGINYHSIIDVRYVLKCG